MSISLDQAQAAIGTSFIVHTSLGTVEFRLHSVERMKRIVESEHFREPMTLIFSAPASPMLAQDNYYVDHSNLGRHFLAIVPVIPPENRPQTVNNEALTFYQIIFN